MTLRNYGFVMPTPMRTKRRSLSLSAPKIVGWSGDTRRDSGMGDVHFDEPFVTRMHADNM